MTGRPAVGPGELLTELEWRGILHATTPGLASRLATGRPISGYIGFDPSGASLHVGHLVPIFGLIRLQRFGGRPFAVVGGGTGMIGDPSGRSSERSLLDLPTLEANVASLRVQLERFLDFTPGSGAVMVNNLDWLGELSLIEFLRDTGKHFTVPYMLAKDSVQVRLERGLSFTEFSYMLLQAYDFAHLHHEYGVELQMGGADQWGNITAGLELIRRIAGGSDDGGGRAGGDDDEPAHGLAYKLLLSPSGTKFGKSETGDSVWLDPQRTAPYDFYQYWLRTDDRDVGTYLRWFTEFNSEEIEALEAEAVASPERRPAQRALARDITVRTHGAEPAEHAIRESAERASHDVITDPATLLAMSRSAGGFTFDRAWLEAGTAVLLAEAGVFGSRGEARRMIAGGGVTVNGRRVADAASRPELIGGRFLDVRIGKRPRRIGRAEPG